MCEKCHPSSLLLAIITYASSHRDVKDNSLALKLLDRMILSIKARISRCLHELCILPTDIEKIRLRLQRRLPTIISTDVNLCLYAMQPTVEVPVERDDGLAVAMQELQHDSRMADFFRWRQERQGGARQESKETQPGRAVDMWKEMREKLRH